MALVSRTMRRVSSSSTTYRRILVRSMSVVSADDTRKENIVIVGGGIAGLASAVSLHRLGIRSLVLEQAKSLRTEGSSITLSKNGWKALDAIGVGDELRSQYLEIQGLAVRSDDGKELASFGFKDEDKSQELRVVERRVLLETLASKLPPDAISFSSKLANIENGSSNTLLQLEDGTRLSAEVVIACDGVWSPTAKWMGFREPKYAGNVCFRGLGYFPQGQPYEQKVNYTYGRGLRAGYVPASKTKVYWFVVYNTSSPGSRITDPSTLKKQAKELVKHWPFDMSKLIDSTPDDTITRSALFDRWLWPLVSPPPSSGKVVLVGDAWHPMTPNIGQGACCALEDSVILTQKLAEAIKSEQHVSVEDAFKAYASERWGRVFPMTVTANLVGKLLQSENRVICAVRNNIIVPKLAKPRTITRHTNIEFKRDRH